MNRKFLFGLALLVTFHTHGCPRGSPAPPSILLISIDTLRADRLNCYGYRRRRVSPNLDALARDSVLFEQHITASPWTTPSHMSLFTSLHPSAHGVTPISGDLLVRIGGRGRIPSLSKDISTLPELLRANGWTTAAFTGGVTLDPRIGFGITSTSSESPRKTSPRAVVPLFRKRPRTWSCSTLRPTPWKTTICCRSNPPPRITSPRAVWRRDTIASFVRVSQQERGGSTRLTLSMTSLTSFKLSGTSTRRLDADARQPMVD
jgi:hypothetical protein